jgi:hypothetical protein
VVDEPVPTPPPDEPVRQRVTDREPLSVIQERLRAETDKRARKAGRQL